ncbi:uncharacterized protein B0P05DRAFT_466150, partial [Gilbertella persicaria]|uniref:uncharacterized protein n=1 Tax=Gilbertella persicaria TaxID=101096 RepID=UPI00222114FD
RTLHKNRFSYMFINYCIESQHNQTKNCISWESENRKFNKPVFVSVEDLEYFLRSE